MNIKDIDFEEIFTRAKESTVYAHAMVYIKEVLNDEKKPERERFHDIQIIVNEAQKHLYTK